MYIKHLYSFIDMYVCMYVCIYVYKLIKLLASILFWGNPTAAEHHMAVQILAPSRMWERTGKK